MPTRQDGSSLDQLSFFFRSKGYVLPLPASTMEIRELSYAKMMGRTEILRDSDLIIPDIWYVSER